MCYLFTKLDIFIVLYLVFLEI